MSDTLEYRQLLQLYEQSQVRIITLEQQLAGLQMMIFGSRQERFIPRSMPCQLALDIRAEEVAACSLVAAKMIGYTRTSVNVEAKRLVHPGRMKLPESLRREVIVIKPAADNTNCKKIDEEITEVLEYEPGELYVKQYRRPKYAKPDNTGVVFGTLPSRPFEKAMAGEGLLAQIVIDKYVDHLPLHRQTCLPSGRCSVLKELVLNWLTPHLLIG